MFNSLIALFTPISGNDISSSNNETFHQESLQLQDVLQLLPDNTFSRMNFSLIYGELGLSRNQPIYNSWIESEYDLPSCPSLPTSRTRSTSLPIDNDFLFCMSTSQSYLLKAETINMENIGQMHNCDSHDQLKFKSVFEENLHLMSLISSTNRQLEMSKRMQQELITSNAILKGKITFEVQKSNHFRSQLVHMQDLLDTAHKRQEELKDKIAILSSTCHDLEAEKGLLVGNMDYKNLDLAQVLDLDKSLMSGFMRVRDRMSEILTHNTSNSTSSNFCIICTSNKATTVFMPCRHQVACQKCAMKLEMCPLDRSSIIQKIHTFRVD